MPRIPAASRGVSSRGLFMVNHCVPANLTHVAAHSQFTSKLNHSGLLERTLCGMTLSARNRLEGEIVELDLGGVMAHVVMCVGENLIESMTTKRSTDEMKLKVGDKVSAVIKSTA
jgi:molybdopterin-binding protein